MVTPDPVPLYNRAMRGLCRIAVALLAGFVLGSGGPEPTDAPTTRLLSGLLIEALDGLAASCPQAVAAMDGGDRAVCATVDSGFRTVKRQTRKLLARIAPDDVFALMPWDMADGRRTRWISTSDGTVRLLLDEEAGWLALVPAHPCWNSQELEALGVHHVDDRAVRPARGVERERTAFPEAARQRGTGGFAIVAAVISTDGSVSEACVIHESPHGLGFGGAALEAVRRGRYEPASLDGTPVASAFTTVTSWEIREPR